MKTCPVCGAGAFDDAEVCYGCLYRYGQEAPPARGAAAGQVPVAAAVPAVLAGQKPGAVAGGRLAASGQAPQPAALSPQATKDSSLPAMPPRSAPAVPDAPPAVASAAGAPAAARADAAPSGLAEVVVPFGAAEIVVKFDFSGVPAHKGCAADGADREGGTASPAPRTCPFLREGVFPKDNHAVGMSVRPRSAPSRLASGGPGQGGVRGSHARDPLPEAVPAPAAAAVQAATAPRREAVPA